MERACLPHAPLKWARIDGRVSSPTAAVTAYKAFVDAGGGPESRGLAAYATLT